MIKCQVIMDAMEKIAPRILAEEWDNPGLLLGNPSQTINKIIICLDVNSQVVEKAITEKCDLIISHHPFIFHAIKKIRTDLPQGHLIQKLLQNNIAVFAAHTNLDSAHGGINDLLCELWNLHDVAPLDISFQEELVKLVVFVPEAHAEKVRLALGKAGAGFIGNYSHCSFVSEGTGHFLPLEGTHPFIGKIGKIAAVKEIKVETILPLKIKDRVIKAMLKAHPYEEPAYEIYPLKTNADITGLGRIGELPEETSFVDFAAAVKASLPANNVRIVKVNDKKIKKVALCSGAGAEFIDKAKMMGADVYITGDVKYHEAQRAQDLGINLIDGGHFGTEYPIVRALSAELQTLAQENDWQIKIIYDQNARDPFETLQ